MLNRFAAFAFLALALIAPAGAIIHGSAPVENIGGIRVGTIGTGAYAGYTMVGGENFNSPLSSLLVTPNNVTGRIANNFSERDRRLTSSTSVFSLADPYWTGWQDANDGIPVTSFSDVVTQTGGVLSLKCRRADATEKLILGVRDNTAAAITYVTGGDANGVNSKRPLVTSEVTIPSFGYTGNRIVEVRWRYVAGPTVGGSGNPGGAIWELNVRGGSEAGDTPGASNWNDEADWTEIHLGSVATIRRNGGVSSGAAWGVKTDGSWQISRAIVSDSTFKLETLNDAGTVLGSGTFLNSAANNAATWYLMLGHLSITAGFDENPWVGKEALFEVDYARVWTPSGAIVVSQAPPGQVVLDYSGTGTYTIPPQATLWGGAVDSEYIVPMYGYDTNGPGRSSDMVAPLQTRDLLPNGVNYDAGARQLSFTAAFSAQAGFVNFYVYPQKAGTGFVRPYIVTAIVKPKVNLTPDVATPGEAYTWAVLRGAPRNWDNGNLPLGTGDGLSVVSKPSWLSFDISTKTFTGTAPNPLNAPDDQITFRSTNALGYTTDQVVKIPTRI